MSVQSFCKNVLWIYTIGRMISIIIFHYHLLDSLIVHCGALCLLFVRLFVLSRYNFLPFWRPKMLCASWLLYAMCKASFLYLLMNVHIQFPRHIKATSAIKPLVYRTCAIITRGLYIFYPVFEYHFFIFKEVFHKILLLCIRFSIQKLSLIKSGLWWRAYGILLWFMKFVEFDETVNSF